MGENHFDEDGAQKYLVFQPIFRYFKINTIKNTTNTILLSWQSKGLSAEVIKPPSTSDNSLTPILSYYHASKIRVEFTGSCLKQDKFTYNHEKAGKIYNVYELGSSSSSDIDPTLKNVYLAQLL